jgi:hypothetical protein
MSGCPPFLAPQDLCTREESSSLTFISQQIIHSSHQRYLYTNYLTFTILDGFAICSEALRYLKESKYIEYR